MAAADAGVTAGPEIVIVPCAVITTAMPPGVSVVDPNVTASTPPVLPWHGPTSSGTTATRPGVPSASVTGVVPHVGIRRRVESTWTATPG